MARIRSIKPEFPQSETIGRLSRDARLLFIQLWTIVDDSGRARASSRVLASLLYPFDDDAKNLIDGWLCELEANACLFFYTVEDNKYLQITNWLKHQKIDRPSLSRIPAPEEGIRETLASPREPSMLDIGVGYRNKDISSSLRSEDMPREATPLAILSECLSEQTAKDLIAHRQKLRKPLTARAAKLLAKDFVAYGNPEEAAEMMIKNGWQGFHPTWIANQTARAGPPANGKGGMASLLAKSLGLKNGRESRDTDEAVHVLPVYDRAERGNVSDDGGQLSGDIIDLLAANPGRGM